MKIVFLTLLCAIWGPWALGYTELVPHPSANYDQVIEFTSLQSASVVELSRLLTNLPFDPITNKREHKRLARAVIPHLRGLETFRLWAYYSKHPAPHTLPYELSMLKIPVGPNKDLLLNKDESGKFQILIEEHPYQKDLVWRGGLISKGIMKFARTWNLPSGPLMDLIHAYENHMDFKRDLTRSTTMELLVEKCIDRNGIFSHYGNIAYAIIHLNDRSIPLYFYESSTVKRFFNDAGVSVQGFLLKSPVPGGKINSKFGLRMEHPILGKKKMHWGIDFKAKYGTPVWAAGDGKVTQLGYNGAYGNFISIRHSPGLETRYAHLSEYAPGLKVGKRVKQKDVIGRVGRSGRVTAAHLHYEIKSAGKLIDPERFQSGASLMKLNGPALNRFIQNKNVLIETLKFLRNEGYALPRVALAPS